jgi:predicted nicotinamide N-methyase
VQQHLMHKHDQTNRVVTLPAAPTHAGVVASHLGAAEVVGTDLESNLPLLQRNFKANGVWRHESLVACRRA